MTSLAFEPYFCPRAWGGHRLQSQYLKCLPADGTPIGESWEISGHPLHVSQAADGPWQGVSLNQLWQKHRSSWTGFYEPADPDRFPVLIKLLDCHEALSVQVHPDSAQAQRLGIDEVGKSEAWVILHADPGSELFAGWKAGVDRQQVESHLQAGTLPEILHRIQPRVGDVFVIPSGMVHSIGAGLMLLEVQQCSDATLRLFDWNRPVDPQRPRPLHIPAALNCINWSLGPVVAEMPTTVEMSSPGVTHEQLVANAHFLIDRFQVTDRTWRVDAAELAIWIQIQGCQVMRAPRSGVRELAAGQVLMTLPEAGSLEWERVGPEPVTCVRVTLPQG